MSKSDKSVDTTSSFENKLHTQEFVSIPDQMSKNCMTDSKNEYFLKHKICLNKKGYT